jgi:hypothetical protein
VKVASVESERWNVPPKSWEDGLRIASQRPPYAPARSGLASSTGSVKSCVLMLRFPCLSTAVRRNS